MSKENKFAFPDTNIFLHFQFFTEIVWNEVLQSKSVTIIIPPIVARELDKHKYTHASERVKDRATKVMKKFAELLRSNGKIRPNVNIQFERSEPQIEFQNYNLSRDSQDDHLIASILRFQNEGGKNAVLITNDFSLMVKTHQLNLEVFELPEEYQIKSEENPDKKKIRSLQKELLELKIKIPNLKLLSKDGKEEVTAQTFKIESFAEEHFEDEIKKIKEKYPPITETFKPKRTITLINGKPYGGSKVKFKLPSGEIKQASLSTVEKYNKEIEEFYKEYEKFINEKVRINNLRARTVKLQIKLKNEGNSPAEKFHVVLTFPKDFQITTNQETFSYPEEINPPRLIITADLFSQSLSAEYYAPSYTSLFQPNFSKVKMFWEEVNIKKKDFIYTAEFQNTKLSHGYSFDCPKIIYVTFPQNQTARTFQIAYKITADNLPKPTEGKLNILVDKNKGEAQK